MYIIYIYNIWPYHHPLGKGANPGLGCHMLGPFAPSNIRMSSSRAGSLADHAAERKRSLYEELSITHIFQPIAFESTGVFGQDALDFFYDLAQRSRCIMHDPLTYLKLCQKISVCMQNFNAVSINGCCTV